MGHVIGEIKKVEVYDVDGTIFRTKEEADTYQKQLDLINKEDAVQKSRTNKLKSSAKSLSEINGYYGVFNGVLFRGGRADEALRSMILNTPKITLELLLSLDEVEFEEEGPIKGELPIAEGEFVEKKA